MNGHHLNGTNRTANCTPINYEDFLIEGFSKEPISVGTKVITVTYGLIFLIGLTANVTLIGSLLTGNKKSTVSRAPSTILILNLAIADTMLLLTLPFAIVHRLSNRWVFGNFFCKTEEVLKFMSFYASVFFITAMAVDRYCILCRPTKYDRKKARIALWIVSVIIWCLALLIDVPIMLYARVDFFGICNVNFPGNEMISFDYLHGPNKKEDYSNYFEDLFGLNNNQDVSNYHTDCMEDLADFADYFAYYGEHMSDESLYNKPNAMELSSFEKGDYEDIFMGYCGHPPFKSLHIWLISNFVIGFVFPFAIISVCYLNIMKLSSTTSPASGHSDRRNSLLRGDDTNKIVKIPGEIIKPKKEKILTFNSRAKMIMGVLIPCLILAFLVCWLPYHTWHLVQIKGVHVDPTTCSAIRDVTFCLAFFNSALNPILNSFFLFNNKERLQILSSWLKKVTHLGRSSSYSSIKVRYTTTRSNETGQDSKSFPDVTLILQ